MVERSVAFEGVDNVKTPRGGDLEYFTFDLETVRGMAVVQEG